MTVKELKEKLKNIPDNFEVFRCDGDDEDDIAGTDFVASYEDDEIVIIG